MNIQFRKLHLPQLPEVDADALIELAGSNKNCGLHPPSLPVGVPKSQIVSRSSLDEIIQDIENGKTENITILEWVHCLCNKEKWDTKNTDRSISTSEAIWKAAEQNRWLKQRLFWNLVLQYDSKDALASSLVKSCLSFLPQDKFDREKLEIIKLLIKANPAKELAKLCLEKTFTPYQLFQKYQLPTKALILEQILDNIVFSLLTCKVKPTEEDLWFDSSPDIIMDTFDTVTDNNAFNRQQVKWLLQCLEEMKTRQQIKAVEQLLIKVNPKLGAEYPELINWLRQHYGSSVTNSRWNELSSEAKAAMRKWLGAVSYQDFQKLANLVLDRVRLEDHEHRRLKSRSGFWSNYSDRFKRIRILLPESSVNILGNYLNNQDVSILLNDGSDATEVCVFDFGNWFVVEFFRGDGSETSIIRKDIKSEQTLFHSQLSVKRLRCLERNIHDHEFCWQYFCEQLLRQKNILPDKETTHFKGIPYKYSKYSTQTGLPKPSFENIRKRDRSLERWRQDIARLEREARQYFIDR